MTADVPARAWYAEGALIKARLDRRWSPRRSCSIHSPSGSRPSPSRSRRACLMRPLRQTHSTFESASNLQNEQRTTYLQMPLPGIIEPVLCKAFDHYSIEEFDKGTLASRSQVVSSAQLFHTQPIRESPFALSIAPGLPDAATSTFNVSAPVPPMDVVHTPPLRPSTHLLHC